MSKRPSGRGPSELRPISFETNYTRHAAGSVLASFGDTRVLCTASIEDMVPHFLRGKGSGWITAEYSMLPGATPTLGRREAAKGKQSGRTLEISRLIARSLRAAIDLSALGENTITVYCDVIQADGGTRTASITGACVALVDAINYMRKENIIKTNPLKHMIAAISVGVYKGTPIADLEYLEDSEAETDMNVIMTEDGRWIEVQGTAEEEPFTFDEMNEMMSLAKNAIGELVDEQKKALA